METHGLLDIRRCEHHPFSLRFTFADYGEAWGNLTAPSVR